MGIRLRENLAVIIIEYGGQTKVYDIFSYVCACKLVKYLYI